MSEQSKPAKSKGRIPFEALEDSSTVASWQLPSMHSGGKVVRSAKRDKQGKAQADVAIEKVSAKKKPRQLTAEELQQITEDARREGFQQGLHEGTEQGIREGTKAGEKAGNQRAYMEAKKDIELLQNQLRTLITRLYDPMQQQDQQLENIIVDLVLGLTKRLLSAEISVKPELILNVVQHTLDSLPKGAKNISVTLNDKDADLVDSLVPDTQRDWRVLRDDKLSSGGCVVESETSLVDFSVEERLAFYFDKVGSLKADPSDLPDLPSYQPSQVESSEQATEQDASMSPAEPESKPEPKPDEASRHSASNRSEQGAPDKAATRSLHSAKKNNHDADE